jgi:ABC-type antimicrobial peptide transport system permease subunit
MISFHLTGMTLILNGDKISYEDLIMAMIEIFLQNFAYRINIAMWIYAFAGIVALLIAFLTISRQSYRAAAKNPVEALRYE